MNDFAKNLKLHLEANPNLSRRGERILKILNSPPNPRRIRIIHRMERTTASELRLSGSIDWNKIDWPTLIVSILSILLKILPLILKDESTGNI